MIDLLYSLLAIFTMGSLKEKCYGESQITVFHRFRGTGLLIEEIDGGAICHNFVTTCPDNILYMVNLLCEIVTTCPIINE